MNKNRPELITAIGSRGGEARKSPLWIMQMIAILFVFLSLLSMSPYLVMLGNFFEYAAYNQALFAMAFIFMALSMSAHFAGYKHILPRALLIYDDRIILKSPIVTTALLRNQKIRLVRSRFFPQYSLESEDRQSRIGLNIPMTPYVYEKLKRAGIEFNQSPHSDYGVWLFLIGYLVFFFLIPRFFPKHQLASSYAFIGGAVFYGIYQHRKTRRLQTQRRNIFNLLLFNDESKRAAVYFGFTLLLLFGSSLPLSSLDRKISTVEELVELGNYGEAKKFFETYDSPERKARFRNNYAWFLSVVPESLFHNREKALEEAKNAFAGLESPSTADTYSCALMAAGQKHIAIALASQFKLNRRVDAFSRGIFCTDPKFGSRSIASEKK